MSYIAFIIPNILQYIYWSWTNNVVFNVLMLIDYLEQRKVVRCIKYQAPSRPSQILIYSSNWVSAGAVCHDAISTLMFLIYMFPLGASEMCVGGWSEVGRELKFRGRCEVECGAPSPTNGNFLDWRVRSKLETRKVKWKIEWQPHWRRAGEPSLPFQITAKMKQN